MSWNHNKSSPEERPLHYLGAKPTTELITGNHMAKIILRLDPLLGNAIINEDLKDLSKETMMKVGRMLCHIWSSNTFTVVFMDSGDMGVSKRNAVDKADLDRGIRIAAARAMGSFVAGLKEPRESMVVPVWTAWPERGH